MDLDVIMETQAKQCNEQLLSLCAVFIEWIIGRNKGLIEQNSTGLCQLAPVPFPTCCCCFGWHGNAFMRLSAGDEYREQSPLGNVGLLLSWWQRSNWGQSPCICNWPCSLPQLQLTTLLERSKARNNGLLENHRRVCKNLESSSLLHTNPPY